MIFTKKTTVIPAGKHESQSVIVNSNRLRLVGLPMAPDGKLALDGNSISFKASTDGVSWFTVLDYSGSVFSIPDLEILNQANRYTSLLQNPIKTEMAAWPIKEPILFDGFLLLEIVSNAEEKEARQVDLYFE